MTYACTNEQTYEWKGENYTPLGINAGGIIRQTMTATRAGVYKTLCPQNMFAPNINLENICMLLYV